MNTITRALAYLFNRTRMSEQPDHAYHIFNTTASLDPSLMVHLLHTWAQSDPDPYSILSDIRVTTIIHIKMPNSPEHEFLVVETQDRASKTRFFVLERTVDPVVVTEPAEERPTPLESVKQFCAAISTTPSDLSSLEQGLPQIDKLTIGSVQAASIISDSIEDKKGGQKANDRFLGSTYVYSKRWHGQNVRFLQPSKSLSLYELAIIAKAVHTRFPTYELLREQCYFHAGLIFSAVLDHFGSALPVIEGKDIAIASGLKYGRYRGLKVQAVDPKDTRQIVEDFKLAHKKAMSGFSMPTSTVTTTTTVTTTKVTKRIIQPLDEV